MARVSNEAIKKNQRLVILRKNVPLFELRPLSKKDRTIDSLLLAVEEARADVRAGRVYTQKEVEQMFGL